MVLTFSNAWSAGSLWIDVGEASDERWSNSTRGVEGESSSSGPREFTGESGKGMSSGETGWVIVVGGDVVT